MLCADRHRLKPIVLLLAFVALVLTSSCSLRSNAPHVVLYVSADEQLARKIVQEFEKETGIRVDMVTDTEVKKTTGIVERIRAERANPIADVFWSSEVFMTIDLANDGLLAAYESDATKDWPSAYVGPEHRWYGFAARARVIVYSTERVAKEDVPATWMELTRSQFKGRIVMADPRFGTTGGHLGAMKAYWSTLGIPGYYEAFLEGLAENETRFLTSGNAGVIEAVARGEADIGMTDTDDCWIAKAQGKPIDFIYARHSVDDGPGTGTLLIPNSAALLTNGPNPTTAAKLMDFLLSERVERLLAESESHNIPVHAALAKSFPDLAVPNPLRISLTEAASMRQEAIAEAMTIIGQYTPIVHEPRDEDAARKEDEALDPDHAP